MTVPNENVFVLKMQRLSVACAIGVIGIGALALIGWAADIEYLKSFWPGWVSMKVNTALCFVLSGLALLSLQQRSLSDRFLWAARCAAALVLAVGTASLLEYVFNWDLRIDQLLFAESPDAVFTSRLGLMAPNTAVSFILIGFSFWLACKRGEPGRNARRLFVWQAGMVMTGLIAVLALLGYIFDVPAMQGVLNYTRMAFPTSSAFAILSLGGLCLAPRDGIAAIVSGEAAGNLVLRRLLLPAMGGPILLGWIVLNAIRTGVYDASFGVTLLVGSIMLVLPLVLILVAYSLNRLDAERNRLLEELQRHRDRLQ